MNNGKICVSVCAETADEMIAKIKRAELLADVIEVRFDCLRREELEPLLKPRNYPGPKNRVIESTEIPIISTYRSKEQGGYQEISFADREAFWFSGHETEYCDIEEDMVDVTEPPWLWIYRICSHHDFHGMPSDLESVVNRLLNAEVDKVKIAIRINDAVDAIPVWKILEKGRPYGELSPKPMIPIAMGEAGKWTRILGLAHGSYMTYASLDEGEETADGQITARDLIEVYRVKELDKDTAVYGVIGDPVSSSLSPYLHNAAFTNEGMNAVFIPLLVKNLDEFMRRMVATATREVELNFAGFSVTMPHKQSIMNYLDEIDETAKKIGAVNTVKIVDGNLIGYNTDAHGFITPLKAKFGDLKNVRVAVIGAGGAARACVHALLKEGAEVTVFARDKAKVESFGNEFEVDAKQLTTDGQMNSDIVVNSTPLGMKGAFEDYSPLTSEQLEGVKFVYDLVTRADNTPLVSEAKRAGIPAIGGLEMLISQGLRQFGIWTGLDAPGAVMRQSATYHLKNKV